MGNTTTAIHPGHAVSGVLNNTEWGDGYTCEQREMLDAALIEKFEQLAQEATGDDSIRYCAATSEILYDCHGRTTSEHHAMAPVADWAVEDPDWGELAQEASEYVGENIEEIIGEDE